MLNMKTCVIDPAMFSFYSNKSDLLVLSQVCGQELDVSLPFRLFRAFSLVELPLPNLSSGLDALEDLFAGGECFPPVR